VAAAIGGAADVTVIDCVSEIGSGALPTTALPSAGLSVRPRRARGGGTALAAVAAAFRALPAPVVGRIHDGAFILDLRCLEDEEAFTQQLTQLSLSLNVETDPPKP
jgi:L-seryl-tRNA(Ser) seleniumtransferase